MITIDRVALHNWKCFEGEQELALAPTHYAIVARSERDADRSNWLGKSSLLQAIDYALFGRLPPDCRRKVDWITRGQKMGAVELGLSDGSRVRRGLSLTTSEKVWYYPPSGAVDASIGGAAEEDVERLVGLTDEDFAAIAYVRQRDMAKLVLMDPGPRMDLVSGWLRLEQLRGCEEDARVALSRASADLEKLRVAVRDCMMAIDDAFKRTLARDLPDLKEKAIEADGAATNARAVLELATADMRASAERDQVAAQAARYDEVVRQGKELAAKVAASDREDLRLALERATAKVSEVGQRRGVAREKYRARDQVAQGVFEGGCPLMGKACPAGATVVAELRENRRLLQLAGAAAQAADQEYAGAVREMNDAQAALASRDRDDVKLRDMREEVRRLKPAKERLGQLPVDDGLEAAKAVANATDAWQQAAHRHQTFEREIAFVEDQEKRAAEMRESLARLEDAQRVASAAAQVFGRAQRQIAEDALVEIEARACDLLRDAGIDLQVRVQWAREGSGLASACEGCGQAFPASARVKDCARCGAVRGPNMINKLEIVPSSVSGAAEDLAGAAVQLGASAWLREDRESRWGVAMLDEPVGSMDLANRRAFAGKLPAMLRSVGFAQSLVIAHHSDALSSLPGRIEVTSDGRRSVARVIA